MSSLLRRVLQNHTTRVLLLLFATLMVLIGYFLSHSYVVQLNIHKNKVLSRLEAITRTAALELDANQLEYLFDNFPNQDDIESNNQDGVYRVLHEKLSKVQINNNLESSIYTLSFDVTDSTLFFGVSSSQKPFYRHIYDHYPEDLIKEYSNGGKLDVYKDKNGMWLSAFSPIKNEAGKTIAIVQADNRFEPFLMEVRKEIFLNIGISLIITLIIFVFLFRAMRNILAKEENLTANLIQSKLELEQINKETKDSIIYAKRIQEAILPLPEKITSSLAENFVFYLPRDIVSGDFYWFKKTRGKIFIAAVDCTGHGVSGAFMSLIGNDLLDNIISKLGIDEPDEILCKLHEGVVKVLKQSSQERASRDGMDVALCVIDKEFTELKFSGALRPLIHIRNGELFRVKSGFSPVGGFSGIAPKFETKQMKLIKGDTFYIFSDGFADQFGGSKQKKYMTKRFRDFLLKVSIQPINQQRGLIEREFFDWKGELDQVDDVLVMGFRV